MASRADWYHGRGQVGVATGDGSPRARDGAKETFMEARRPRVDRRGCAGVAREVEGARRDCQRADATDGLTCMVDFVMVGG